MSIRIIVRTDDSGAACHVSGAVVVTEFQTFLISAPEVENFLRGKIGTYSQRQVIGVELVQDDDADGAPS